MKNVRVKWQSISTSSERLILEWDCCTSISIAVPRHMMTYHVHVRTRRNYGPLWGSSRLIQEWGVLNMGFERVLCMDLSADLDSHGYSIRPRYSDSINRRRLKRTRSTTGA